MTLRDRLVAYLRPMTPEEIAARANGPAARALAWEGWLAARNSLPHPPLDMERERERFDHWWNVPRGLRWRAARGGRIGPG